MRILMKILDYVTIENIIPKDLCEIVLKEIQHKKEWEQQSWYNNKNDTNHSEDTKELDILFTTPELQTILAPFIRTSIERYMKHIKSPHNFIKTFTPIRFNRYATGQVMRRHHDHIHSIFEGQHKGIPILSLVGLLNDNYEGAKMVVRNTEFPMKRGDIIIMPSVFLYPHEITECTKGTRYSWVSWAF